jgi:hypothetical protein
MDIAFDSVEILCENVHFVRLEVALYALSFARGHYILHVFVLVDVGYIS